MACGVGGGGGGGGRGRVNLIRTFLYEKNETCYFDGPEAQSLLLII